MCLDCLAAGCKADDIRIRMAKKLAQREEFDLSRRQALGALASGAAGVLLLGTDLRSRRDDPRRIRPPGVTEEDVFLSTCLRCSQCMKICPTTALQPAFTEAGLEGLWTPILVPRVGYCDYGCTACGQVCPSGAIPLLALEEKRQQVIGKASIDRNRCLPWASAVPCVVCEEMCPLAPKAIRLEDAEAISSSGELVAVKRPSVFRDLCIGCGICEHDCPLEGEAAIRVANA
jgi:formate hydrogenlyase subunit 6/NADH:ubiquinone oxidoreductase subunit I